MCKRDGTFQYVCFTIFAICKIQKINSNCALKSTEIFRDLLADAGYYTYASADPDVDI